ncbi:hypothetical protein ACFV9C_18210 [Kribbella sp. NPDC059898]|uniref:hypothetical protein n=1 Tax=Kribbella sp. NPDC059898 TaxID=3346995 RepID=UPI00364D426F
MVELSGSSDSWLIGGVDPVTSGAENGFLQEVDRVIEILGEDQSWLGWWRRISKAPVLEIHMIVVRAGYGGPVKERFLRGRKRHLVEMRVDFDELEGLEPDERRLLALPAVLNGVSRAQQSLKLAGPHPEIPDIARPARLSAATLRRRRLRELRGETTASVSHVRFRDNDDTSVGAPDPHSVSAAQTSRTVRTPDVIGQDRAAGQPVVEIHVPLNIASGASPGDPREQTGWIDVIEDFLNDEASDGSFVVFDDGEELGDVYVFFVAGPSEEILLSAAREVASLPGVPAGAFAVVTDDKSECIGTGRHVALG